VTTLVVGRGLLGHAVIASLEANDQVVHTIDVPWGTPSTAAQVLLGAAARVASTDRDWRLVWTAGAGVVATSAADLDVEVASFETFLRRLARPPSAMFLASSAGGVYAGSPDGAPFSETSVVRAASPYGRAKLAMESAAEELAGRGSRVLLGRLANLYGPGQNLSKPQGLVSQLCVTQLTRQPLTIHAAMDSLRDYLYVSDAARMVVSGLDRLTRADAGQVVVKIFASGVSRSVGSVIGESTRVFRRRPHLVIRSAGGQVMDLRLRSTTWPDMQVMAGTPFPAGLRSTAEDIAEQMRSGRFAGFRAVV
jgi:UDP-glucose 4-epimerase